MRTKEKQLPRITFCISGWLNGVPVSTAMDSNGDEVDVTGMSSEELIEKLRAGDLVIDLVESLVNSGDQDVELKDFAVSPSNDPQFDANDEIT